MAANDNKGCRFCWNKGADIVQIVFVHSLVNTPSKMKTELERDVVEQELDRNCEMSSLLMN